MTPLDLGFFVTAAALLYSALRVVSSTDLVRAVYWLAAALVSTAVLYGLLEAPFLAGVQVLTYVGGIVTLMIFGVMVTRRHDGSSIEAKGQNRFRALLVALGFLGPMVGAILRSDLDSTKRVATVAVTEGASTRLLALSLLGEHLLAFEAASVLLLAAIVGAVVLARRRDVEPERAVGQAGPTLRHGSRP
jgi:NADH:ubiquinone oxidoreductase subunit 6 (subunit J)